MNQNKINQNYNNNTNIEDEYIKKSPLAKD